LRADILRRERDQHSNRRHDQCNFGKSLHLEYHLA
jgi:hypothetical protein